MSLKHLTLLIIPSLNSILNLSSATLATPFQFPLAGPPLFSKGLRQEYKWKPTYYKPKYFKAINEANKLLNYILSLYVDTHTFITTLKEISDLGFSDSFKFYGGLGGPCPLPWPAACPFFSSHLWLHAILQGASYTYMWTSQPTRPSCGHMPANSCSLAIP